MPFVETKCTIRITDTFALPWFVEYDDLESLLGLLRVHAVKTAITDSLCTMFY